MGSKYKECGLCMECAVMSYGGQLLLWLTDAWTVNKMHASVLSPEVHVLSFTYHSGK